MRSVYAEEAAPVRAFNLFYGLGYQRELQATGFDRKETLPIAPLVDRFPNRLAYLTKVNQVQTEPGTPTTTARRARSPAVRRTN